MTSVSDTGKLNLHRLALFLIVAGVSLFFWISPLLAPFKIFVVFIHETGHALATVLTGGHVLAMVVTPWESGYVQHVGGNPLVIASSGYVGSAVFGGIMMWLSGRARWASPIFAGLALLFGLVTILFVRNGFGVVFGLGTAVAFGVLAWKSMPGAVYLIDILAVMSSLYALYDLTDFLLIGARTDATILAQLTYIPAFVWAILWSGISLLVVYVAGTKALTRP